ncbi:hypothetical protein CVV72_10335 [Amycolatopsis sp. TNS106]|nr:hypothetical protein CVV72_10335 [Amycolatopsis sp. TNS106]
MACPPRVEAVLHQPGSWGWIPVTDIAQLRTFVLAHDEEGYLWVKAAAVPTYRVPNESDEIPGAIVFHLDGGIGLWVHPKSYKRLGSRSRTDMQSGPDGPDAWIPINEVTDELPAFVAKSC